MMGSAAAISLSGQYRFQGVSVDIVQEMYHSTHKQMALMPEKILSIEYVRRRGRSFDSVRGDVESGSGSEGSLKADIRYLPQVGDCWIERRAIKNDTIIIRKTLTHLAISNALSEGTPSLQHRRHEQSQPFSIRFSVEMLEAGYYPKFDGTFSISIQQDENDANSCMVRWTNAFLPAGPAARILGICFRKQFKTACTRETLEEMEALYQLCLVEQKKQYQQQLQTSLEESMIRGNSEGQEEHAKDTKSLLPSIITSQTTEQTEIVDDNIDTDDSTESTRVRGGKSLIQTHFPSSLDEEINHRRQMQHSLLMERRKRDVLSNDKNAAAAAAGTASVTRRRSSPAIGSNDRTDSEQENTESTKRKEPTTVAAPSA